MKKTINNEFQEVINFLKSLPEGRKIYIEMSGIWIEVTKEEAINYLKSAYSINHSEKILAEMGDLFFKHLKRPNEAISYYQTHIRLYGCSELICKRLATIYRFLYDNENLIEIYKKLLKIFGKYDNKPPKKGDIKCPKCMEEDLVT